MQSFSSKKETFSYPGSCEVDIRAGSFQGLGSSNWWNYLDRRDLAVACQIGADKRAGIGESSSGFSELEDGAPGSGLKSASAVCPLKFIVSFTSQDSDKILEGPLTPEIACFHSFCWH